MNPCVLPSQELWAVACMTHDDAVEQPGDTVPLVGRESGTTPAA
jgi:hypothetical protein